MRKSKHWAVCFLIGLAFTGLAEVESGENILLNGSLEADQVPFPQFWGKSHACITWKPSGGPRPGMPFVRMASTTEVKGEQTLRQHSLRLAEGGRYRFSAWVRTKDFSAKGHGIAVVNNWWRKSASAGTIPADTKGKWVKLSNEFTCFESENGLYSALAYVSGFTGEFDIADIRLEAVDEIALAKTERSAVLSAQNEPRLLPYGPLLGKIPADDPVVTWRFLGKLPKGTTAADYTAEVEVEGKKVTCPLVTRGDMRIRLPEGARAGVLTVRVVKRDSDAAVFSDMWRFAVVDVPKNPTPGKRLNNLCTELVNRPIEGGVCETTLDLAQDGWIYARVGEGTLAIDGREVIAPTTPRHETFRRLAVGRHALCAKGSGAFVVRRIADIINYCPGASSHVRENGRYDWDFQERFVLPAVTTQNGGDVEKAHRESFLARGYRWTQNVNRPATAEKLAELLEKSPGMTLPAYGGTSCDEQYLSCPGEIDIYTKGLKAFDLRVKTDRPVCSWTVNKPATAVIDDSYFATAVNICGGNGQVWFEAYCRTRTTENEAVGYIDHYIGDTLDGYRKFYPPAVGSTCVVLGNFNQVPILSLHHHPEVDIKYFLDMQVNYLANNPRAAGVGGVGYWGSYYADEEFHRWSFALMRHYVIEGQTEMLSKKYGFTYRPELVKNGDFRETLDPWRTSGAVTLDSADGFATASQNRWGGNGGIGDTFAVLTREEEKPAQLGQEVHGLVPGRLYCFQFATFDVDDVKAHRIVPRRFGIGLTLGEGAKKREDLSWVFVDNRVQGRYSQNNNCARINLHHVVFEATAETLRFALDNKAAKPGEKLGVNFVSLNLFFSR